MERQMIVVREAELKETIAEVEAATDEEDHDIRSAEVWHVERFVNS